METLLMDPLSALIGGAASLVGGLMNTSSTQSINAANIQQQIWSAEGGYLPGLVANANKAGLNPLAVLGSRGPNMAVQVGTQPGAGLQEAGRQIAQIDMKKREYELELMRENVMQQAAVTKNTMIRNAVQQKVYEDLESGRTVSGPEPAKDTSLQGAVIDFMRGKSVGDILPRGNTLQPSNEPWSWRDYGSRLWNDPSWYQGR
jgi:hypothetical protein